MLLGISTCKMLGRRWEALKVRKIICTLIVTCQMNQGNEDILKIEVSKI